MASDVDVDYDNMVKVANKIASLAEKVNDDVYQAYQQIKQMKSVWFGASYDRFVTTSNSYINQFDRIFKFIVTQGPSELAAKAVSYSHGDLSTTNKAGSHSPKVITDVPLSNKAPKLRFHPSDIATAREQIETKFQNAGDKCDEINELLESVEWESVAATSTKSKMKTSVTNVKTIMGQVKGAMSTIIKNQTDTINAIEGAAEAVEAGKDIVLDIISDGMNKANDLIENIGQAASDTWRSFTGND